VTGWLTALRIARREARRAKGRSALVVALIGLPVLALSFAAVSYDMFTLTAAERLDRELGSADAELSWAGGPIQQRDAEGWNWDSPPGSDAAGAERAAEGATGEVPAAPTTEQVGALLPTIDRVAVHSYGAVRLVTATGTGQFETEGFDLSDPLLRGVARVTSGRAPAGAGEAAVTASAAARLGVTVGEEIERAGDGSGPTDRYVVVGTIEFPNGLSRQTVLFHPAGMLGGGAEDEGVFATDWLIGTSGPVAWDQVQTLNQRGFAVRSRAVVLDPPAEVTKYENDGELDAATFGVAVLVAGLAVLEIVLLAGPAFAVGARRRQRELALVAVGGGTPAQLRRIVLADGVVLGSLGAGIGLLLGVVTAFAARPLVTRYLIDALPGGYRVFPLALAGIAVVAVGTGVLAALVPAFTAARQQPAAALAGRRGITRIRKRWLFLGLAMVAIGAAVTGFGAWQVSTVLVLTGLIVAELGLVLCTPAVVGLVARLGSRLPLASRIALRDTARNRSAAAPAISAVMAAVAGAAAAGVVVISMDRGGSDGESSYPPGTALVDGPWQWPEDDDPAPVTVDEVEARVRATLPVDQIGTESHLGCGDVDLEEYFCTPVAVIPEQNRCPYWEVPPPLSAADQRAANRDRRCDYAYGSATEYIYLADDGTALPVLAGAGADRGDLSAAVAVLRDGGVVVTEDRFLHDGTVTIQQQWEVLADGSAGSEPPARTATVPGYHLRLPHGGPGVIVSPGAAAAAGLEMLPGPLVVGATRMPTQAEEDAFVAAMESLESFGYVLRPGGSEIEPMLVLLAAAAGVVALGAAGIATSLAAADRRPDLATLGAVGASPRVRRSLALSQSGVIAGLGTGLGLLVGLGAAVAVLVALNQRYASTWPSPDPIPITVPWLNLGTLVAVPVVAMLGAGLLTRSRLPIERRPT
jgi:putative ABC transport system permease protein